MFANQLYRCAFLFLTITLCRFFFSPFPISYAIDENLILDPGFETKQGWDNWGGFYMSPAAKNSGSFAAAVDQAEGGAGQIIDAAVPGKTYILKGNGSVNRIGQEGIIGAECLDKNGKRIPGGRVTLTFKTPSFEEKSASFTTVPDTAHIQVYVYVYHAIAGGVSYFDDISLVPASCTYDCHTNNAAFLPNDWFAETQAPAEIEARVKQLSQMRIRYQMADVGMLTEWGMLDARSYAGLAQWLRYSKEAAPDQVVIAVLNFNQRLTKDGNGNEQPNPLFGKETFNQNVNQIVQKLVHEGIFWDGKLYRVDGVHLDMEPFLPDDRELENTLRYLREHALSGNRYFSVAAPVQYGGEKQWSYEYIQRIASIVDQINPMVYDQMGWDSPIDSPYAYQTLWTTEMKRYSDAILSAKGNCQLLPIMPAYERRTVEEIGVVYHDPYVENIYSAAKGLVNASQAGANIHGAGIFWWATFIGDYPELYPRTYYLLDQEHWMKEWVHHS
ncbi:glycoside hydrolase family 18 protein [Brevibacillus centrosporus]|uniref:glycoside hydrolase family 18 protein n=1 Tax=Brevibacillus centrosporus TaxID=54910 RepID=UPI003B023FED